MALRAHILGVVPRRSADKPEPLDRAVAAKGARDHRKATKAKAARKVDAAKAVLEGLGLSKIDGVTMTKTARAKRPLTDEARVRAFERLLAAGMTETDLQAFALKEWGAERAEVDRILAEVEARWRLQDAKGAVSGYKAKYRRTLLLLLQSSTAQVAAGGPPQHTRNALRCLDQLCRLDGVYEPEKISINAGTPAADEVVEAMRELDDLRQLCEARGYGAPAADLEPPPSVH